MTDTTAVLVHGALSDASIWDGVIARLQADGISVLAPALAMRNLDEDAAYLRAIVDTIDGPVVLAGHSYGGTVISHPALQSDRIKGLVYVAAFQPEAGESTGALNYQSPGSRLGEQTILVRPYPGGSDVYLRPEAFAEVYAADLDPATAAVMAAAQRPIDAAVLDQSFAGSPTWAHNPSWTLISTDDRSLPPEAMRWMSQRAGSVVVEVATSHAAPVARPAEVASLIRQAVRS
jgi:pimeloyl-ACP methyl ester carboxylesterase